MKLTFTWFLSLILFSMTFLFFIVCSKIRVEWIFSLQNTKQTKLKRSQSSSNWISIINITLKLHRVQMIIVLLYTLLYRRKQPTFVGDCTTCLGCVGSCCYITTDCRISVFCVLSMANIKYTSIISCRFINIPPFFIYL